MAIGKMSRYCEILRAFRMVKEILLEIKMEETVECFGPFRVEVTINFRYRASRAKWNKGF